MFDFCVQHCVKQYTRRRSRDRCFYFIPQNRDFCTAFWKTAIIYEICAFLARVNRKNIRIHFIVSFYNIGYTIIQLTYLQSRQWIEWGSICTILRISTFFVFLPSKHGWDDVIQGLTRFAFLLLDSFNPRQNGIIPSFIIFFFLLFHFLILITHITHNLMFIIAFHFSSNQ